MAKASRRYLIRLGSSIAAYAVLLVGAMVLAKALAPSTWRYAAMLLPLPALVALVWAILSYVREADEMLSRDTVAAAAIGFAGGSVITFTYGLLQLVGAPELSWLWVWPVFASCWILGGILVRRRRR